jgi:lipoate-protein ligase A
MKLLFRHLLHILPLSFIYDLRNSYGGISKAVNEHFFSHLVSDYVFGDRKFGGNAQSITRNRWIHHTSFLWDYEVRNMAYLKRPARAPEYRLVC